MNNFANSLLHLLLSWMRALFGGVLSLLQGDDRGLLAWLSRHWLPLTAVLLLAGLVLDVTVYIIRWRPQYVWRTRLRRFMNREEETEAEIQFNQGFDTALADFNFADTPIPDLTTSEAVSEETLGSYLAEPAPAAEEAFDYSQLPGADQLPAERRRRSERHSRRFGRASRLRLAEFVDPHRRSREVIDPREAFNEPVYPASEAQTPYTEQEDDPFDHV